MTDFSYIPTVDLQNAIDTLKAERLGWWRLRLPEEHRDEIDEAHETCILILRGLLNDRAAANEEENSVLQNTKYFHQT